MGFAALLGPDFGVVGAASFTPGTVLVRGRKDVVLETCRWGQNRRRLQPGWGLSGG